jgi:hypothetical protein
MEAELNFLGRVFGASSSLLAALTGVPKSL